MALWVAGLALILGFSYLAALGPLALAFSTFLMMTVLIGSAIWAYRLSERPRPVFKPVAFTVLFFMVATFVIVRKLERVTFFVQPSNSMAPALLAGDRFALDHHPSAYESGDLVAVEIPRPTRTVIRRLQRSEGDHVVLAAEAEDANLEDAPASQLRGKVLYISYSLDPESHHLRWDRLLKTLQ